MKKPFTNLLGIDAYTGGGKNERLFKNSFHGHTYIDASLISCGMLC